MKIPAALDLQCGKKGDQKPCDERRDAYYEESLTEQSTANAGIRIAYLDESDLCLSDSDQSHNDNVSIPEPYSEVVPEVTSPDYSESSVPIRYYETNPPKDPEGWQNQIDYFFSVSSLALNISSILHFASCAAKNGGGAFCVAYLVLMMICGLPLAYLETCIGQYAKGGPVIVWKIMPIAKGLSWAMLVVTILIAMYYSVIMSWSLYYAGMSIIQPLPWICSKTYTNSNNPLCESSFLMSHSYKHHQELNQQHISLFHHINSTNTSLATALYNLPSGIYFQQTLLLQSEKSISGNWQLVLCLLATWLLVFIILIRGIQSMAKIMYLTAILPYILVLPLLICICMLDGALPSVKFFLTPGWDALQKLQVWSDATKQLFLSLALGTGSISVLAGYTHFHSNCFRFSLLGCSVNLVSTEIMGLLMFAIQGVFTKIYHLPLNRLEIPALDMAFIIFPEITSLMPFPPVWSALFYIMLTIITLNSIVIFIQLVVSGLEIMWPMPDRNYYKLFWLFVICVLSFICSLFILSQADIYTDQTMDVYLPSWSLPFICFFECLILMWFYGPKKILRHITDMTGSLDRFFWKLMWKVVTPTTILVLSTLGIALACSSLKKKWDIRQTIGWILTSLPIFIISLYIIHKLIVEFSKKDNLQKSEHFKKLIETPPDWGPGLLSDEELQNEQCSEYVIQEENNRRPANALAILTANLYFPDIGRMVTMDQSDVPAGVSPAVAIAGATQSGGSYLADAISITSNESTNESMTVEENKLRGYWNRRLDFMLSCLGYVIGLGNIWRFPYLVHRNGGGAFFIPYVIMLIFCGIPLAYMELAYGQYGSLGPITVWKAVPFFKGIGYGMVLVSAMIAIYYTMVTAWAFHFLFSSMTTMLPWRSCSNSWNTKYCKTEKYHLPNCSDIMNNTKEQELNLTNISVSTNCMWNASFSLFAEGSSSGSLEANVTFKTPSEEYFYIWVLNTSKSIGQLGTIRWQLALCLLLCWVIVFLCVFKGIKSSGKVVYLIVIFPYIIMFVLLIRGITVDGHLEGIKFYLTPKWEKLKKVHVWGDAAAQVFFSLSLCWGGLSTLSSYNKFHNNIFRDAIFVCLGDSLMSLLAGFSVFAVMGVLGKELNTTVENVVESDVGLAFTAYPAALTYLPAAPLWAILFFLMLVMMGLSTEITVVETVVTAIIDEKIEVLRKKRVTVLFIVCMLLYFMGLPMTTEGGLYILQLMDECTGFPVMIIGICMCVAIAWVYGVKRFCANITHMIQHKVSWFWRILWMGVSPVILLFVLIFSVIDYKPLAEKFVSSAYPYWSDIAAFFIMTVPVISIPFCIITKLIYAEGTFKERIRFLCESEADWGPALEKHWEHIEYVPTVFTCSGSFSGFGVEKLPISSVSGARTYKTQLELHSIKHHGRHKQVMRNADKEPSRQLHLDIRSESMDFLQPQVWNPKDTKDHVEFTTSGIRVPSLSETTSLISLSPKLARNRKQLDMRQRAILNHAYSNPQCNSSAGSTERLTRPLLYEHSDDEIIIVPRNQIKVQMHDVATQTDSRNADLNNANGASWQNVRMSHNSIFSQSSTISLDRTSLHSEHSVSDYRGSMEKVKMADSREELRKSKTLENKMPKCRFSKELTFDYAENEGSLRTYEATNGICEVQFEKHPEVMNSADKSKVNQKAAPDIDNFINSVKLDRIKNTEDNQSLPQQDYPFPKLEPNILVEKNDQIVRQKEYRKDTRAASSPVSPTGAKNVENVELKKVTLLKKDKLNVKIDSDPQKCADERMLQKEENIPDKLYKIPNKALKSSIKRKAVPVPQSLEKVSKSSKDKIKPILGKASSDGLRGKNLFERKNSNESNIDALTKSSPDNTNLLGDNLSNGNTGLKIKSLSGSNANVLVMRSPDNPDSSLMKTTSMLVKNSPENNQCILIKNSSKNPMNVLVKKSPDSNAYVLMKNSPEHNTNVFSKNSPEHNGRVSVKNSPENNASVSMKNSPEHNASVSMKNSPEHNASVSMKNSPEHNASVSMKNSPEHNASVSMKNSPEHNASVSMKNSPEHNASASMKNSPEHNASVSMENSPEHHSVVLFQNSPKHNVSMSDKESELEELKQEQIGNHTETYPSDEVGFTHSTSQSSETSLPDTEDGPAVLEIEVTQMTKL
ncbi:uncharacterized protein LOC115211848 isoform X2 [Octopus sinensis]|uniref:Transporter n=1 Tax=Octopus sinensis TaxID=2607531 RepID=A0A7E6EUG8_9MOLL|nr:uncharacterized protein LOC115211848 isoform X2 [Octopus sinensis]